MMMETCRRYPKSHVNLKKKKKIAANLLLLCTILIHMQMCVAKLADLGAARSGSFK